MIELRVIDYRDRAPAMEPGIKEYPYRKAWTRGKVSMLVGGTSPVDSCAFDNPELSLICRADLLATESSQPAAYLADLYTRQGDAFATALRGTFAIILYDHLTRTLKAWSDHFGAQRLVYTESSHAVGVATDLRLLLS